MSNDDIIDGMRQLLAKRCLNERDIHIISGRINGNTLDDVGQTLGITRERVRQLQNQIMQICAYYNRPDLAEAIAKAIAPKGPDQVISQYRSEKQEIQTLLKTGFPYERLKTICQATGNPSEQELCQIIYQMYHIVRFHKYMRCYKCGGIKTQDEVMPSYWSGSQNLCRNCNTKRTVQYWREKIAANPERRKAYYAKIKVKNGVYWKRYMMKKQGRYGEIPPLPPKGKVHGTGQA